MKVLVTGGGGFLGAAICRKLVERGDAVTSLARNTYPALDAIGVRQVAGDITSLDAVFAAAADQDAVIHVAAKAGAWGAVEDYYAINVGGTDRVIAACSMRSVRKLVYTSTPSVVHAGRDLEGVDESTPYATHFLAHYPATKCIAEQRVLAANSPELTTVALRPHLIWGPGDNHLLPRLVARARAGRLRFIGPPKLIDVTYIDNAAQAHVDALDRLAPDAACAGRAYFISQGEPIALDAMVNALLKTQGLVPETRRLSLPVARVLGAAIESAYRALRIQREPPLSRFIVEQLSTAHWYDISAARRDLGYEPTVSTTEGLRRLSDWTLRGGTAGAH